MNTKRLKRLELASDALCKENRASAAWMAAWQAEQTVEMSLEVARRVQAESQAARRLLNEWDAAEARDAAAKKLDFAYTVEAGEVTITGYTGPIADVVVPAKIDGLPVTVIGSSAFQCSEISGITLPSSITTIKSDAFGDCHSLTSIVLREGLTTVESSAFAYCELLTTIILPNSLVTIGDSAFYRNHPTTERRIGRLSEPEDWMCTEKTL